MVSTAIVYSLYDITTQRDTIGRTRVINLVIRATDAAGGAVQFYFPDDLEQLQHQLRDKAFRIKSLTFEAAVLAGPMQITPYLYTKGTTVYHFMETILLPDADTTVSVETNDELVLWVARPNRLFTVMTSAFAAADSIYAMATLEVVD